jgi:hypothetical protein
VTGFGVFLCGAAFAFSPPLFAPSFLHLLTCLFRLLPMGWARLSIVLRILFFFGIGTPSFFFR